MLRSDKDKSLEKVKEELRQADLNRKEDLFKTIAMEVNTISIGEGIC